MTRLLAARRELINGNNNNDTLDGAGGGDTLVEATARGDLSNYSYRTCQPQHLAR